MIAKSAFTLDLPEVPAPRPWLSFSILFPFFALELVAISFWRIPNSLDFGRFAFCDEGANLTVQYLIAHGYRPELDFGYHYGLLPLILGRLWFRVFGLSAHAYLGAMLACNVVFAWALARICSALEVGPIGLALTALTLGFAMQSSYPNLAHALETVLLAHGLSQQARGARPYALALAAVAIFVKPSMAYIFGFLLVLFVVRDLRNSRAAISQWPRRFVPAMTAGTACAALVGSVFGLRCLVRTIVPLQGAVAYHTLHYGFFEGSGRSFWAAPGMPWFVYFIHVPGFWIAASVYLLVAGAIAGLATWRRTGEESTAGRRNEIIFTCAVLHLVFVVLLFGNRWSWIYYFYLLSIGVAAAADLGRFQRRAGWLLCMLALFSWTATIDNVTKERRDTAVYPDTAGLYATPEEASEWRRALDLVRGGPAVILYTKGSAELSYPELEKPTTLYLDPGLMEPAEIRRKVDQLASARYVVTFNIGPTCGVIPDAPEFSSAMHQFEPISKGEFFDVFRRR